jgi:hypothetical protein
LERRKMPLTDTYRVVVSYSEAEDPSEYGVLKVEPFGHSNRKGTTREYWQDCHHHDDYWCGESIHAHVYWSRQNMDQRFEPGEDDVTDHSFVPRPEMLTWLDEYNSGWKRNRDIDGDESGGVLILKEDDPWWHKLSSPEQQEAVDAFLQEYSAWWSGETYYALLQQWQSRDETPCPTCGNHFHEEAWLDVDGLGGLVGDKAIFDQVKEWASEYKVDWLDIEIKYE